MKILAQFVLAAVLVVACATPAILIDHAPHPCGEYPVDCGHGRCCPEHNACIIEADGTPACEYVADEPTLRRGDAGGGE